MYQINLSPYAKIFYNEWLLDSNSFRYNVSYVQTLYGRLDEDKLRQALKKYIADHLLLNSHIQEINAEPHWIPNIIIRELEYSDHPVSNAELLSYVTHKFDLYNDCLYRFKLIRLADGVYKFVAVLHHLVLDGSSSDIGILEGISCYYNNENYTIKYSIKEQIELITNLTNTLSAKLEQHKNKYIKFWQQQLCRIEPINLAFLKLDRVEKENKSLEYSNPIEEIRFDYGGEILSKLDAVKLKFAVTPYIFSQSVFALLLYRYTGQKQLAISYPLAIKEGIDFIYGVQLNINLIPYKFQRDTSIIEILNNSKEFFHLVKQEDVKYSYYPINELFNALGANINKQLLNIAFIQTVFRDKPFEFVGITKVEATSELNVDSVPKEMLLFEQEMKLRNGRLNYRVRYDRRNLNQELVTNFIATYKRLFIEILDDLLAGNDKPISNYSLLDASQYHQIVYEFNRTEADYPRDKTISQLFEDQVQRTPDNIAVVYENRKLTYNELNHKANQLAYYLLFIYKVRANHLIALLLNRSEYMIIGILAVLKAGGAYVPISPDYPEERIKYILEDTKAEIIITDIPSLEKKYKDHSVTDIIKFFTVEKKIKGLPTTNNQTWTRASDLAYVIYTSGTTGEPKGVMVEHKSVARLVCNTNYIQITSNDKVAQASKVTFDAATFEIWGALLNGAKLVCMTNETVLNNKKFAEFLSTEQISILLLTTTLFEQHVLENPSIFIGLKYLLAGGEVLTQAAVEKILYCSKGKPNYLLNAYGPTENTTISTTYNIRELKDNASSIPIGKFISNTTGYVLDKQLNVLPIGAIGELYVGGEGLARGYLNQPKLTAKKFIYNPFQTTSEKALNKNTQLYKTGDLVRWLPDGNLEYIGRNDSQVKIRGFRIELGEIESKLLNYPEIKQAAVLVKEQVGDKYLAAYYVADKKLDEIKICSYLTEHLPDYMLPSMLMYLHKLPLTVNGKLDRAALPELVFASNNRYVAPRSKTEKIICAAFGKILEIKKIGVNDDFFKLGGNSLKAINLIATLQNNFSFKVVHLLNLRTPLKLAEYANNDEQSGMKAKLELVKLAYRKNFSVISATSHPSETRTANDEQLLFSIKDPKLQQKIAYYLTEVKNLKLDFKLRKPIKNVLLTGVTGFLGANLLNQLLKMTDYNIYLLVRAKTKEEAFDRINKKYQFYFDQGLETVYDPCSLEGASSQVMDCRVASALRNDGGDSHFQTHVSNQKRVFVFNADLEQDNLGLTKKNYAYLTENIDSIIHSAALVKHYGDYDQFYAANVQATINLLEFTKLTKLKDFHYISTRSVLDYGFIPNCEAYVYTEDDLPHELHEYNNYYVQTKLQGERQVLTYRSLGITSNIYRVGNLAFIAENCRPQENLEENAFFNWLKFILKFKMIAENINTIETSPVDTTASAVVKLFDKKNLDNNIYHFSNPNLFNLSKFFAEQGIGVKTLAIEQFIDEIIHKLNDVRYNDLIVRFLLHQGWLESRNVQDMMELTVLQERTMRILQHLGFNWQPITNDVFNNYIKLFIKQEE